MTTQSKTREKLLVTEGADLRLGARINLLLLSTALTSSPPQALLPKDVPERDEMNSVLDPLDALNRHVLHQLVKEEGELAW